MLKSCLYLLLLMSVILAPYISKAAEVQRFPDTVISVWGDEEMCLAYHRSDFFYVMNKREKIVLIRGDQFDYECSISNLEVDDNTGQMNGLCGGSELKIWPNHEDNKLHMSLGNVYLSKCSMSDMILGIGKDPKNVEGDFGFAAHAGFTIGYGVSAAQHCGFKNLNDDVAKYITSLGMKAANKYALKNRRLPPEIWAQKFIDRRSEKGIEAFQIDKEAIPDICDWIVKAYGQDGWVVDGFIDNFH